MTWRARNSSKLLFKFRRLEEGETCQESPAKPRAQKAFKVQNLLHLADVARSVRESWIPVKSEKPHTKIPVQDALPTLPLPDTLYTTKWLHRIRQGGASCRAPLSLVIVRDIWGQEAGQRGKGVSKRWCHQAAQNNRRHIASSVTSTKVFSNNAQQLAASVWPR